jgi:hypothetical protein
VKKIAFVFLYLSCLAPGFAQNLVFEKEIQGRSVVNPFELSGNRYVIAGNYNGGGNGYLLCLDANGDSLWQTNLAYPITHIQQTNDKGLIIFNRDNNSNLYVVKTDNSGVTAWQKMHPGFPWDVISAAVMPGEYILLGSNYSDVFLAKLDSDGNLLWEKTAFAGVGFELKADMDGNILVAGAEGCNNKMNHALTKLDSAANILMQYCPGSNSTSQSYSFDFARDGGYFLGGFSWYTISATSHTYPDFVKLNANLAEQSYSTNVGGGGEGMLYDISTADSGYVAGGYLESTSKGTLWIKTPAINAVLITKAQNITKTLASSDGGFLGIGPMLNYANGYIIKYNDLPSVVQEEEVQPELSLYPNPFSDYSILELQETPKTDTELSMYDLNGKLLSSMAVTGKMVRIERKGLPKGMYFLQLRDSSGNRFMKLIVD